jgi:hypothetical protein
MPPQKEKTMQIHKCEKCKVEGYYVATTAGEILEAGEVVAVAPADRPWLMVDADGDLLCDSCAAETD